MNVSEIMYKDFIKVKTETEISEVLKMFSDESVEEIFVQDEQDNIVGIITHTDLLYKDIEPEHPLYIEFLGSILYVKNVALYKEELKRITSTKADELMSQNLHIIAEETTIEQAAKIMVEKKVGHLPVIKDGRLVGVVRKKDVVKYVLSLLS